MSEKPKEEVTYLCEAGIFYRRDTKTTPLQACESLHYYTWQHRTDGGALLGEGRDFVVIAWAGAGFGARARFLELVNKWNRGHPGRWFYIAE